MTKQPHDHQKILTGMLKLIVENKYFPNLRVKFSNFRSLYDKEYLYYKILNQRKDRLCKNIEENISLPIDALKFQCQVQRPILLVLTLRLDYRDSQQNLIKESFNFK